MLQSARNKLPAFKKFFFKIFRNHQKSSLQVFGSLPSKSSEVLGHLQKTSEIVAKCLRWLEIVYWRARPVSLNTATESRSMHATFKLNMLRARAHQARACANNDLVPSKSLENLDFDQKYL